MPATAKSWGVDPMNAPQALDAAAKHMAQYVRKYGSYRKALAAYNAGEGAVQQYGGVPPYAETRNYVSKILGGISGASYPGDKSKQADSKSSSGSSTPSAGADLPQPSLVSMATPVPQMTFAPPVASPLLDTSKYLAGTGGPSGTDTAAPTLPQIQPQTPEAPSANPLDPSSPAVPQDQPFTNVSAPTKGAQATLPGKFVAIQSRADKIDAQHRKYLYGGGHGTPSTVGDGKPIDCSAAVSMALGISTRVSGDMGSWGKPGRGSGKNVVNVYYNGGHTFMEINGHFWGTSGANPGGGAGWIPRSRMDAGYLSGFKVRHVKY
jgi:hypothetical protein